MSLKKIFIEFILSVVFISAVFATPATRWEWEAEDTGGTYTGSISAGSGHKVTASITLTCDQPQDDYYCEAKLFRESNDSDSGLKYSSGRMGSCDSGGVFNTAWVIDNSGGGIRCGKGGSAACTDCMFLTIQCKHIDTETVLVPTTVGRIIGDCP